MKKENERNGRRREFERMIESERERKKEEREVFRGKKKGYGEYEKMREMKRMKKKKKRLVTIGEK